MKKLVIVGNGEFAKLLYMYIKEQGKFEVVAFASEHKYISENEVIDGLKCIDIDKIEEQYPPNDNMVIIGVGYSKMNTVRKKLFDYCKNKKYEIASFIHDTAYISKYAKLGEGNIILEFSMLAPSCEIGDGNILWDYVCVGHDTKVGNFNLLSGGTGLSGYTYVGDYCFLGKHSYTEDHIRISDYTLVGAGAGVKNNTYEYDVVVPAKSITLDGKKSTDFI